MKLHHFALQVKDIDASIKFYTEKLGFKIKIPKTPFKNPPKAPEENGFYCYLTLDLNGSELELVQIHNKEIKIFIILWEEKKKIFKVKTDCKKFIDNTILPEYKNKYKFLKQDYNNLKADQANYINSLEMANKHLFIYINEIIKKNIKYNKKLIKKIKKANEA